MNSCSISSTGRRQTVPIHSLHIQVSQGGLRIPDRGVFTALQVPPRCGSCSGSAGSLAQSRRFLCPDSERCGVETALRRQLPTATIISGCAWVDVSTVAKGRLLVQYGPVGVLYGMIFFLSDRVAGTTTYPGSSPGPFPTENLKKSLYNSWPISYALEAWTPDRNPIS